MDINSFMESFKENLLNLFNGNLLFLGLQGSYGRGEAKESSDIDPVIILRQCGKDEILKYRSYIDTLPEKDILCGFVSSSDELRAWESAGMGKCGQGPAHSRYKTTIRRTYPALS